GETNTLLTNLPDLHSYPVSQANLPINPVLTAPPTSQYQTANIAIIDQMLAYEYDRTFLEKQHVIDDMLIERIRDERISNVFGYIYAFPIPSTMQYVDYRNCLESLSFANFSGSTVAAVNAIGTSFTGVPPT